LCNQHPLPPCRARARALLTLATRRLLTPHTHPAVLLKRPPGEPLDAYLGLLYPAAGYRVYGHATNTQARAGPAERSTQWRSSSTSSSLTLPAPASPPT